MKQIFTLLFLFSLFSTLAQNKIDSSNIHIGQLCEHQMNLDDDLNSAVNYYYEYLRNKGVGFQELGDTLTSKFVKNILFPTWMPNSAYEFYVLNLLKSNDSAFFFKVCFKYRFIDENGKEQDYYSYIYNAKIVGTKDNYKMDYNLRTDFFNELILGNIKYYYKNEMMEIDTANVISYCKKIEKIFSTSFNYELIYVPTNYFNAFEIFGFDYTIESSGRNIPGGILVSVNETFIDKHELTHAVLKNIHFPRFLSEGIATYFGGSNGIPYKEYLYRFKRDVWLNLSESEKEDYILKYLNNDNTISVNGSYNIFFYIVSAMIVEELINKHGLEEISILTQNIPMDITPNLYIDKYLDGEINMNWIYKAFD